VLELAKVTDLAIFVLLWLEVSVLLSLSGGLILEEKGELLLECEENFESSIPPPLPLVLYGFLISCALRLPPSVATGVSSLSVGDPTF